MQQPTCTNLRIRSTADAHKVFTAVNQGLLFMVSRRLDADERLALRSGCIYAWEERGPQAETTGLGIERFTEGRRWSPSRVRDEFLFYYEKYSPPPDLNNPGGKSMEVKPPRDWDPLVKQTYSVWVETEKGRRKWHLTAYFTQATIDHLGTIDDIPRIRELEIPEGKFKSTRLGKNRAKALDENKHSDVSKTVPSRAVYPSSYQYQSQSQKGSPNMQSVFIHEPYHSRQSAEPHSPATYDSPHSPVSAHDAGHGHYHQDYSNENGLQQFHSNSYHRSLSNSITSFSHSKSNDLPLSARQEEYYPSSGSPSSWSNDSGLDYTNSPPPPEPSSQLTHIPSTYNLGNQADNSFGYTYQPPASMQNNHPHLYSTHYSLNSGYPPLSPPPALTLPNSAERGVHLSTPERSNGIHFPQDSSSPISPVDLPTLHNGPESYTRAAVPALAPLHVIRRPIHRREPQDELSLLRMLRASQPNP